MKIRSVLSLIGLMIVVACTSLPKDDKYSALKAKGDEKPEGVDASGGSPILSNDKYPILFGTNRQLSPDRKTFTAERAYVLRYGTVWVDIPKDHKKASLGKSKGIFNWSGDDPPLTVKKIVLMNSSEDFVAAAAKIIKTNEATNTSYYLVFIHGFNNSFNDAAIRAAQLGIDLDVPKFHMMMFSWPSLTLGFDPNHIPYKLLDIRGAETYTRDESSIEYSEKYLKEFLITVNKAAKGKKVHVIAHSMGNRALLRVVSTLAAEKSIHFGQIILAAADIDRDLFEQLSDNYLDVSDKTTVYASPYDYAVGLSQWIHKYPRVGCGNKRTVVNPKIDNVISTLHEDFPSHAYFAATEPMLLDIKNLLVPNGSERAGPGWSQESDYWRVGGKSKEGDIRCH